MAKNKKILNLVASLVLLGMGVIMFALCKAYTAPFWISLGFVFISYFTTMVFTSRINRAGNDAEETFLRLPIYVALCVYLLAQFIIVVIYSIGSTSLSVRNCIITNILLQIIAWIVILLCTMSNDYTRKQFKNRRN